MAANLVVHGRRRGHQRSLTDSDVAEAVAKPSQVKILPFSEWKRINEKFLSWQNPSPGRAVLEKRRKEALHQQSQSTVQHWENTIEGQRLKRLQARKLREEEEEKKRQEIDEEEAIFQAAERKKAIERAKTLLYYQTDRVKRLNGALVLSEVLRERDAQLAHKKKKTNMQKTQEDLLLQFQAKERQDATNRDRKIAEERRKDANALTQYHLNQKEEKTQRHLEERLAALDEQKRLDQEAAEQQSKQKGLLEADTRKQMQYRHELDMVVEGKEKAMAEERREADSEDNKIRIYLSAKKQMERLRKEKKLEFLNEFQTHQQLMRTNLQQHMETATNDEDQRVAEAVREKVAKRDAELREKQMEYIAASKDIHRHMLQQMAEQEQAQKEQEAMDQRLLKRRVLQDQKFRNHQLEMQKAAKEDALKLQEYQCSQIAEIKARGDTDNNEALLYHNRNKELLKVEETQFGQYASKLIAEARERGGPVKPLIAASTQGAGAGRGPVLVDVAVRPSYKAMDAVGKELPSFGPGVKRETNTQKRLGFIW